MKNSILILSIFIFFSCTDSEEPQADQIPSNGIQIGNQIWMKKNLDVKTFRNGDPIQESKTTEDWIRLYNEKKPAWTTFEWDENSEKNYGVIYNYYAIIDPRGIAPEGWRIPTSTDFFNLVEFNGGKNSAPIKLMSRDLWVENPGNNESGFNATPGSEIWIGGSFGFKNEYVTYWTTSSNISGNPILFGISCLPQRRVYFVEDEPLQRLIELQKAGLYIRCIKE